MKKPWTKTMLLFAIFAIMFQTGVSAEGLSVSSNMVKEETLYAFVKNPGEYETVTCQIGLEESPDVTVKELTDPEISVSTYILIDNSLSIQEQYRDTLKQVAKDLIYDGKDNESFTLATFDTDLHYLVEGSQDTKTLINTVDQIEFQNQDTQIINVLYQVYEKFDADDENSLKRIIFMSDGAETKTIGYTREELMEKVDAFGYPVYMLGCTYNSNVTELENMFRISRETGAAYFLLDDMESADQIADGIASSFDMVQVRAAIPEGQRDGSSKGVKITFEAGGQEQSVSFSLTMPFLAKKAQETESPTEPVTETETETEAVTEPATEAATEPITEPATEAPTEPVTEAESETAIGRLLGRLPIRIVLPAILLVIAAAAVITVVALALQKKKEPKQAPENPEAGRKTENEASGRKTTEFVPVKTEMVDDNGGTVSPDVLNIRLTDTKRPAVIMEYSLETTVLIGRDPKESQIVFDYEPSVSARHCRLKRAGDKVYIENLSQTNFTQVDGKKIEGEVEIESGSVIKMGRLLIEFQIASPKHGGERKKSGTMMVFGN